MPAKLTPKQEKFCQEYIVDLNATQAAIRAGYSPKTAGQIGEQNLKKLEIKNRVQQLRAKQEKRTEITADAVLKELALLAFGRVTDLAKANSDGHLVLDFRDATPEQKAIITGVKTKSRREKDGEDWLDVVETEVKVADKVKSLELLGKHLGLFKELHEHTGKDGGPIQAQSVLPDLANMTPDELMLYLQMTEKARASVSSP